MSWLESADLALFRFVNSKLANPVCDALFPSMAGNEWFVPVAIVFGIALLWRGGLRARLFLGVLLLTLALGDGLIINPLKDAFARVRPSHAVEDVRLLVGAGGLGSMPSSHTSTWFAIAMVALAYYPRSRFVLLPFAVLMGFSRVYLGVHYPSDVIMGALLGSAYGAAGWWGLSWAWGKAGRRWFPLWWERLPRLWLRPNEAAPSPAIGQTPPRTLDERRRLGERQWFRLGVALTFVVLAARLFVLAGNHLDLSEDEAYQWVWSKHMALSYYSKPLLIAVAHWVGTHLWGDTEFGVRFLPPVLATIVALLTLRFMNRIAGGAVALVTVLVLLAAPILAVGSTLMTIDPLLVTFWTAAMVTAWRAVQPDGTTGHWALAGLWTGLGFLSKYTAALFIPSLALFFLLWKPARAHLRRPGPWVMLAVVALSTAPVLIWNASNGWITVQHVSENAKLNKPWEPTLRYFLEFLGAEFGLFNPVFFVAMLVALVQPWRERSGPDQAAQRYLFCAGAPLFLGYWAYTLHSRVQANWPAAAVVPLLCLMMLHWRSRWQRTPRPGYLKPLLIAGLTLGILAGVILTDTSLIAKATGVRLPAKYDPTRRVRGIEKLAGLVGQEQRNLQAAAGRPVFIVTSHYGLAGQLSFYLPEARAGLPDRPLVYPRFTDTPKNQFYFWPEYRYWETRRGQDALYVMFEDEDRDRPRPFPAEVAAHFSRIEDLGTRDIIERKQVLHRLRLYRLHQLR